MIIFLAFGKLTESEKMKEIMCCINLAKFHIKVDYIEMVYDGPSMDDDDFFFLGLYKVTGKVITIILQI